MSTVAPVEQWNRLWSEPSPSHPKEADFRDKILTLASEAYRSGNDDIAVALDLAASFAMRGLEVGSLDELIQVAEDTRGNAEGVVERAVQHARRIADKAGL